MPKRNQNKERHTTGIWLIAVFKLVKGVLLLALGIGALSLLHKDVEEVATDWINILRVDPNNYYINKVLDRLLDVDDRKLEEISAGTFFYAAMLLTEGTGLMLRKRWAEYFTVIATGSFIPLEVYELVKHFTPGKIVIIAINVAVVWYLIERLRRRD